MPQQEAKGIVREGSEVRDLEDRSLLTGIEHKILGSTPGNLQMASYPRIPQAILEGSMTIGEVNEQRQKQEWFLDTSIVFELGGMDCLERYIALISLPKLDPESGQLDELPYLHGFFDQQEQRILTVERDLDRLPIEPTSVNRLIAQKFAELHVSNKESSASA